MDLNTRNERGDTLLTQAVKEAIKDGAKRRLDTIQVLLRNEKTKGLTNAPNNSGKTPRAIANQANNKTIVALLAEHGAVPEQKPTCPRPQHEPEPEIYQPEPAQPEPKQEERAQEQGTTDDPLFAELNKGNRAKIKNIEAIISQKPGDLTRQRTAGKTPLMHAIESRVTEQMLRDIIEKLTPEHINLEEHTRERHTALTKAIKNRKKRLDQSSHKFWSSYSR